MRWLLIIHIQRMARTEVLLGLFLITDFQQKSDIFFPDRLIA